MMENNLLNSNNEEKFNFTSFCFALLVFILIFRAITNGFMFVRVDGNSMYDTLLDGDVLIVNKYEKVDAGDIVVFDIQNRKLVKRVIAMAGDEVKAVNGTVYVKYKGSEYFSALNEDYLETSTADFDAVLVEEGRIFVLGDNRGISNDSRQFGTINLKDVNGVITQKTVDNKEVYNKIFGWIY